jgi:hypothetical protein
MFKSINGLSINQKGCCQKRATRGRVFWFGKEDMEKDYYKILGVDRNADDERIQEELDREAHLNETVLYPYTEKLGNCEVVFLGGAHLIYIQKPDECGEVLKSFIDGLDS